MKTIMVIPSYWARKRSIGHREGDAIYDHPTPLDEGGTLGRLLESTGILREKDFRLVVLAAATAADIEEEAEAKIRSVIDSVRTDIPVTFFSHTHLRKVHEYLHGQGKGHLTELLSLRGYSNIRNLGAFVAQVHDAEVAVLIDEDEVFEDPEFMGKAREFVGGDFEGRRVLAIAGYYINPDGQYLLNQEVLPWMAYWNKIGWMNEAFRQIIAPPPRLKETPFVFGGAMVLHRDLYRLVPFDLGVPRGEDIDFLINARMFGIPTYLDNELWIKHDPPPKPQPTWRRMREDIYRFIYEREKLRSQVEKPGMSLTTAEQLQPYPGRFLGEDLREKIFKSNQMLALQYELAGDREGAEECLRNIYLAEHDARPKFDPFQRFLSIARLWRELMAFIGNRQGYQIKKICV